MVERMPRASRRPMMSLALRSIFSASSLTVTPSVIVRSWNTRGTGGGGGTEGRAGVGAGTLPPVAAAATGRLGSAPGAGRGRATPPDAPAGLIAGGPVRDGRDGPGRVPGSGGRVDGGMAGRAGTTPGRMADDPGTPGRGVVPGRSAPVGRAPPTRPAPPVTTGRGPGEGVEPGAVPGRTGPVPGPPGRTGMPGRSGAAGVPGRAGASGAAPDGLAIEPDFSGCTPSTAAGGGGGGATGFGIVGSVTPGGTGEPGFLMVTILGTFGAAGFPARAPPPAAANSVRRRLATMSSTVLRFDLASIPSSLRRAIASVTLMFSSLASWPTRTLPI